MKKCNDCNVEMITNAEMIGEHPFELGVDGESDLYISYVNGKKTVKSITGKLKEKDNYCKSKVKVRLCPKCGKVELYVDINK